MDPRVGASASPLDDEVPAPRPLDYGPMVALSLDETNQLHPSTLQCDRKASQGGDHGASYRVALV